MRLEGRRIAALAKSSCQGLLNPRIINYQDKQKNRPHFLIKEHPYGCFFTCPTRLNHLTLMILKNAVEATQSEHKPYGQWISKVSKTHQNRLGYEKKAWAA